MRKLLCVLCLVYFGEGRPELKLVHVIFSHKFYAPFADVSGDNSNNLPRNLSYEYFQSSALDLPNEAKLNMYNLGLHLREVYGEFLGDKYTDEIMKMRTSENALSMIAGQLVNAALWLPKGEQKWSQGLNWQPTPADYVSREKDTLLLGMNCPSFISETNKILSTEQVQHTLGFYSPLFQTISHHTGMKIRRPSDVALLYSSLETKADLKQSLPYWAADIFPYGAMYNLTLLEYDLLSYTPLQRKLNGGTMLKEIIGNCLQKVQGVLPGGRKMMLYSGDGRNLAGVLNSLDLWSPHIPSEAASLIFELYYDNSTGIQGLKVKYYTGIDGDTMTLKIANCTEICPLKFVLTSYFDVLPEMEQVLCSWKALSVTDGEIDLVPGNENHASSFKSQRVLLLLLILTWSSSGIL